MPRRAEITPGSSRPTPSTARASSSSSINRMMVDGKKSIAERLVYKALDRVAERTGKPPVEVLEQAIKTVHAGARGPVAPRRRRRTTRSRRGAAAPRPHARRALDRAPSRASGARSAWTRSSPARSSTRSSSRARIQEEGRHVQDGAGQQGLCALQVVMTLATQTNNRGRASTGSATSGSWPTSTRARRRRPSGSSTTPGAPTRWGRYTRRRRHGLDGRRSRSAASRSPRRRRRRSGATFASTSSIRPGTWTLRSRSSARCASWTARLPFRLRRRRRAEVRDGLAAGRLVQRPADRVHQQDGPRRRGLLQLGPVDGRPSRREARADPAADRPGGRDPRRRRSRRRSR